MAFFLPDVLWMTSEGSGFPSAFPQIFGNRLVVVLFYSSACRVPLKLTLMIGVCGRPVHVLAAGSFAV